MSKKAIAVLATAVPAVFGAATPAGAQQANPRPTSCAGVAFTDAAGDAATTSENLDLRAGFLRYVTDPAGESVLTANIQVTDLDETRQARANSHAWTFGWIAGGIRQHVRAALFSDGLTFSYRTERDVIWGETTGRMFPGKDGIVEIVIPVAELGLAGKRLTDLYALSEVLYSDGLNLYPIPVDRAPGIQTGGPPFDVVPCAQEGAATAPPPTALPAQAAAPTRAAGAPRLNLEVVVGKLSARKISNRRSLSIRLLAGETTTALQARLKRGKKLVATGKLSSITGKGTVRLRLRGEQLTAGTYALQLTGRTGAGQVASRRVTVRIRP
jgi:hypothetical protein